MSRSSGLSLRPEPPGGAEEGSGIEHIIYVCLRVAVRRPEFQARECNVAVCKGPGRPLDLPAFSPSARDFPGEFNENRFRERGHGAS